MDILFNNFVQNSNRYNLKLNKVLNKNKKLYLFLEYLNIEYYFKNYYKIHINMIYLYIKKNKISLFQTLNDFNCVINNTIKILETYNKNILIFTKKEQSIYKKFNDVIEKISSLNFKMIEYYIIEFEDFLIDTSKLLSDNIISKINKYDIKSILDDILYNDEYSEYFDIKTQFYERMEGFEKTNEKLNYIRQSEFFKEKNNKGDFWLTEIK